MVSNWFDVAMALIRVDHTPGRLRGSASVTGVLAHYRLHYKTFARTPPQMAAPIAPASSPRAASLILVVSA